MSCLRRFHLVFLTALLTLSILPVQAQNAPPYGRFYFGAGNNDYNSVIFKSNLDSSNTIALTGYNPGRSMHYPSVSADGSIIAFASNQNAEPSLRPYESPDPDKIIGLNTTDRRWI